MRASFNDAACLGRTGFFSPEALSSLKMQRRFRTSSFLFQQSRLSLKSSAQYAFQGVEFMFLSKRQPSFEPAAFLQNTQHVVEMQGFCPKETALLSPKKHFRSDFFQ
jgi:hypothetical protein